MTQIVNPSIDRVADSFLTAGSLAYAGLRDGGIVPSGEVTELAKQSAIDETVLDGFSFSTSSSSLDVTISPGEAFVFGSWIAKDTTTTVTLPPSSTVSGIILTRDKDSPNTVQIGLSSDFDEFPDPDEYLIVAGGFLTDENGVTQSNDPRKFVSIDAERLEGNETSEIKPDISDSGSTVVENAGDINVEGFSASNDGDGSATIVGAPQYTDADSINAVDSEDSLSVNITGDANSVDGFSFVENGNSGPGIINYQTSIEATGGTTVIDRTISGVDYRIHYFENVGMSTFSINQVNSNDTFDVLIVGGGGSGGGNLAGGGGGGGVVHKTNKNISSGSYTIVVGGGGNGVEATQSGRSGNNGDSSSAFGLTALGGGGGGAGTDEKPGLDGGSGGGASGYEGGTTYGEGLQPSSQSGGFGNRGGASNTQTGDDYPAGGGGGAGEQGEDVTSSNNLPSGDGGNGVQINIDGNNYYWGGGGGGGSYDKGFGAGNGGLGGGGGGSNNQDSGTPGVGGGQAINSGGDGQEYDHNPTFPNPASGLGGKNTGGGSGGTAHNGGDTGCFSADGGSGIVIIRYKI